MCQQGCLRTAPSQIQLHHTDPRRLDHASMFCSDKDREALELVDNQCSLARQPGTKLKCRLMLLLMRLHSHSFIRSIGVFLEGRVHTTLSCSALFEVLFWQSAYQQHCTVGSSRDRPQPEQRLGGFRCTDSQLSLLSFQGVDLVLQATHLPPQGGLPLGPASLCRLHSVHH